jgi:hypothetical protein
MSSTWNLRRAYASGTNATLASSPQGYPVEEWLPDELDELDPDDLDELDAEPADELDPDELAGVVMPHCQSSAPSE